MTRNERLERNRNYQRDWARKFRKENLEKVRTYHKAWRIKNIEKSRMYGRKGYAKHRKERLAYSKAYNEKNREKRHVYMRAYLRKWRERNKERKQLMDKKYYKDNKKRCLLQARKWVIANMEKRRNISHRYLVKNREEIYRKIRYYNRTNSQRKLYRNLSRRIHHLMTDQNVAKSATSIVLTGISMNGLKNYIEKQFKPGMTWTNYGRNGWHIDHIKPCASFDLSNPKQQKQCFRYTNLQPLWAFDNLSKGSKWEAIAKE